MDDLESVMGSLGFDQPDTDEVTELLVAVAVVAGTFHPLGILAFVGFGAFVVDASIGCCGCLC